jgi:hypothetical protein
MGEAARRHALDHFSASAFVSNYLRMAGRTPSAANYRE